MTNRKSTKRALIASVISLMLCFGMLLGTTYAWFTDSVTSANNIIKSGNLDIALEYWNGERWVDVEGQSDILTGNLWEPGHTDVAYLRFKNEGSLALKYALSVNIVSETAGVNKAGETFLLSDYIYFDVVDGQEPEFKNREAAMAAIDAASASKISTGYTKAGELDKGTDYVYLAMVVYMPTSVGNVANHDGKNVPQIDLGINIFATQNTVESDSYGSDYDANITANTVAKANEMLAANKDVVLAGCNELDGILVAPANYTGTLTIVNSSVKSVQAQGNVNIVILGNVIVNANGSGTATAADGTSTTFDGSAITANGELNISGNGNLTAIAADVKAAFGIGGVNVTKLTIKDVNIGKVTGSFVQPLFESDTKYGKTEPEGGAAIGSGYNGAEINLVNVTIENALGGSKSAGIGARYWTGVTVNVTDSIIKNVEGGNASAGIGGSRVSSAATTEENITINITNSVINAKGGQAGAGIGSGYDTHCLTTQPMCTINITDSSISAIGGKYAAGVGTGYHNAALSGEIKNSTVAAKSGDKFYKDTYTQAIDVGFGVIDPAREGKQRDSKIVYNGVEIGIPYPTDTWDGTSDTTWYNEADTEFVLSSAEALVGFAELANSGNNFSNKTIVLDTDVDMSGMEWTPVKKFAGTLKGNDHTIKNFTVDATTANGGFFDVLEWGTVEDVIISDVTAVVGSTRFGTLARSINQTNIDNVTVKNVNVTTVGSEGFVAGLFCHGTVNSNMEVNNCTVENLTVNAAGGAMLIGGITTFVQKNGTEAEGTNVFENLHVKGFKVTVSDNDGFCKVGGLVSQTQSVWQNPRFNNCSVSGLDVVAAGTVNVGGFMNAPGSYTYAENCTVDGKIDVSGVTSADYYAGGFFGDYGWGDNVGKGDHKVTDCTADVDITTKLATAGGFVGSGINTEGRNKNITLTNCEAKGTVTCVEGGTATIGGFVGATDRGIYVNCVAAQESFIGKVLDGYTLTDDGNGTLTVAK